MRPVNIPPLPFPHLPPICTIDGDWQLQVRPGAPGTARQGPTRIIMLVNYGGVATQPRAPGHERPHAASSLRCKPQSTSPRRDGGTIGGPISLCTLWPKSHPKGGRG